MIPRLRSCRLRTSLSCLLFLMPLATHLGAAEPPTPTSRAATAAAFLLRPGVVVDPGSAVVYVMQPGGGIEALEVDRGTPRWSTTAADVPLLVHGDLLFAMRQQDQSTTSPALEIVALGTGDGQRRFAAQAALPAATPSRIDDGLGTHFGVRAWSNGPLVHFSWTARWQTIGGMPSSTSAPETRTGMVTLDYAAERLVPGDTPTPLARRPDVPADQRLPNLATAQFFSGDQRHVLASEQVTDDRTFEKFRWTVVSAAGDVRLGTIRSFVSQAPFGVVGERLLHESPAHARRIAGEMKAFPLSIRSIDLRTGQVRWTRPIRDTSYAGPFPP